MVDIRHPDGRRYRVRDLDAYERLYRDQGYEVVGVPDATQAEPATLEQMTNEQLRAELAKAGREAPAKATKRDLIRLLRDEGE